jgi:DNA-binding NarL/FixJ family response regulator
VAIGTLATVSAAHLQLVPRTTLVVAHASPLVRDALAELLERRGYDVVARAVDAPDLRRRVHAHHPDVVVADPALVDERLDNLVAIGEDVDVAATVRQIDTGGRRSPRDELSRREREVLGLMAEGLSNQAIAERLWLSERSVEANTKRIYDRLGLLGDRATNRRVLAVLSHLRARPHRAVRPAS